MVSIYISLMTSDAEHLFMSLGTIKLLSFGGSCIFLF